jgi:uncharacterized membrane protein YeaQ/YmgE (transglycosylase-associated protein family)
MWILIQLALCVLAGWLAGKIMKGSGYGVLVDLLLGLVGGWIGGILFGRFLAVGGLGGGLLVRLVGAILLVVLVRLLRRV